MRVLAALSGGVDSAVAAARAVDAGHEVVGVHMALSRSRDEHRTGSRGCCTIEDASDARRSADVLGIPFYVWDLSEQFERTVVADFLAEYAAGRTPNPCVRCNEHVKFAALLDRAVALGFDAVCTGHYARVAGEPGALALHRARDAAKDQSYVLAVMGPERLARSLFPLGDAPSKDEVRAEALRRGLPVSAKPDSYDVCFVADGDTRGFLRSRLGAEPGPVVDETGAVLGTHEGAWAYTVGQRKGLGLGRPAADGRPRYVLDVRPATRTVVVGPAELLAVDGLEARDAVWFEAPVGTPDGTSAATGADGWRACEAQLRAHGTPVPARVRAVEVDGTAGLELAFDRPVRGLAAGQSAVCYHGDRVLAHATIARTVSARPVSAGAVSAGAVSARAVSERAAGERAAGERAVGRR